MKIELLYDLESYHAWAMEKVFELCRNLDGDALKAILPLGPGSLLATLQHMAAAERVWLDRWHGESDSPMHGLPDSIDELEAMFAILASERIAWFDEDPERLNSTIQDRDMKRVQHEQILGDLAMHVLNHAIHHRAQVVHFLKRQGQTFPGGIDYIFYRIARPTILLGADVAEGCRKWGLEVGETTVPYDAPDLESLAQYCRYGDWAMNQVFDQCLALTDEQLNQDWGMGVGSIRKTLLHIYDAECFWQANWDATGSPFPSTPTTTTIDQLIVLWADMSENKSSAMQRSGESQLGRVVTVNIGGGPMDFRFSESLLQLSVHGTLHRAQATNMIRSSGKTPKSLDYVTWLRQTRSQHS